MLLHFLDNGKFGNVEEFEAQFQNLNHEEQVRATQKIHYALHK